VRRCGPENGGLMALRTVGVRLTAEISAYQANMKSAGQTTRDFVGELSTAAKKGHLDAVANQAAAVGLGLVGVAGAAVKLRADFDKSMSAVSAATHASSGEIDQLRTAALQAGKDTQYSATAAANGITELSKAGVSTADVLNGGLKGALALAAAGQIDVGEAAETAASAMTQFKLKGDQIPHVADLLAAAAGKAQGSVHDMGYALNQSGLVAAQFGLSIEDTTGALAEFASAGLIGSDAGTSFKTMLLAIANPSKQTTDMMSELGVSFYDAQGKFIGLSGVAQVLQTRLKGLTEQQREAALGQIFGSDAIRSASILYTDGAAGVQKWATAVNDSGYASSIAAKLTDNLAGDLERLRGSLETVAIQSGGGATQGLRSLTQTANLAVNAFADLPAGIQESVTVLSGIGGASLLAGAGFIKARSTAKDFLGELREMGPVGTRAADSLGKIGSIGSKLGVAGVAAVGLYEGFRLFGDWVNHFSAPTARDVDKMGQSLQDFARNGSVAGELAKAFGTDLRGLQRDVEIAATAQQKLAQISSFTRSVYAGRGAGAAPNAADRAKLQEQIAQARTNLNALDQSLANLVNSGNATAAKIAFNDFASAAGLSMKDLTLYQQATVGASSANSGLAKGFGSATSNAQTLTDTLESAIKAGQAMTAVWAELNGAVLGSDKAMLDASQAIDTAKQAFKDNGDAITGNSEAALRNRIAVGNAAEAAAKAAQAKYEETGSVTEASRVYDSYIAQLRRTLMQSGLNKQQTDQLLSAYARMPASVSTRVTAPGAATVIKQVRTLKQELDSMKTNWNLTIRQNFLTFGKPYSPEGVASGQIGGLASGGAVTGSGPKGVDSEPRILAPGEHVWTAREVDAAGGQQAVAQMRAAVVGGPVRMAGGGPVAQTTRVMPARASVATVVVHEHRVTFADTQNEIGQLLVKAIRTSPGVRAEMAQRLGVRKAG
jgi:TP901 family phage tail tape measure protein